LMDSISDLSIGERVNIFSEIVGIQIVGDGGEGNRRGKDRKRPL
jgi:hypothetical protein